MKGNETIVEYSDWCKKHNFKACRYESIQMYNFFKKYIKIL